MSAFDEPQKLIGWAHEAIKEAHAARQRYLQLDNFQTIVERDPESGGELTRVKALKPFPPDDFARNCTEALNNLRNSFDQTLFAACEAIGKPIKDAHYPWADNPGKSLDARLKRSGKSGKVIPLELWDTIRRHEPYATSPAYPGGNDLVRELATIANRKHTVGFQMNVNATIVGAGIAEVVVVKTGPLNLLPDIEWDPVNNEVTLPYPPHLRATGNNYRLETHIAFKAVGQAGKLPAELALAVFAAKANEVFQTLKARAIELGAS